MVITTKRFLPAPNCMGGAFGVGVGGGEEGVSGQVGLHESRMSLRLLIIKFSRKKNWTYICVKIFSRSVFF